MDAVSELILLFNDTDKNEFRSFLRKKNKRHDVKNIRLFDILETDDINSQKKLYKSLKSKDAYHALRKRLHDNLLLFLSQKTFESNHSEAYDSLRLLIVSRFLMEHNLTKTAFKCLQKAEQKAVGLEQFGLLNEILLLRLQYAHLNEAESLTELTQRFRANQDQMRREAQLQLAYAFLRQEFQEVHLKGKVVDLSDLIHATMLQHHIDTRESMTYKSLYQILFIANEYADINQNYGLIEPYVKKSHQFIQARAEAASHHRYHHLHILYYLANFNLRQRSFTESMDYLRQMERLMQGQKQDRALFYLRHQLLLALNHHFGGDAKQGIAVLANALKSINKESKPEDVHDLQICLTMFLAQHNDKACLREMAKLTHTDTWYENKLGMFWTIRKNVMEILIHAQFENIELAVSRLKSFRRRYKKYLETIKEQRVLTFVLLTEKYLFQPDVVFEQSFQHAVLRMLDLEENKDIFNLSFIAWLVALWERRTPYEVMISLLNLHNSGQYISKG